MEPSQRQLPDTFPHAATDTHACNRDHTNDTHQGNTPSSLTARSDLSCPTSPAHLSATASLSKRPNKPTTGNPKTVQHPNPTTIGTMLRFGLAASELRQVDGSRKEAVPALNCANSFDDVVGRAIFGDEAGGACPQRLDHEMMS